MGDNHRTVSSNLFHLSFFVFGMYQQIASCNSSLLQIELQGPIVQKLIGLIK